MNAEQLAQWLQRNLPRISRLQLDPKLVQVRHVMNWGGFVNHSFTVDDGCLRYHLKITDDLDNIGKLRRWHTIHEALEQRYRAPKIIDWVDFPQIGLSGLLLEHVDGTIAHLRDDPVLVEQLVELLTRLHEDPDLQSHLNVDGSGKTYGDHFVETYIERFNADLEIIEEGKIPFVSSALVKWMHEETQRLRDTVVCAQAFSHLAREPVHGDLNEGNVLVSPKDWFIVDWDDLAAGDPALDFAVLLWPMIYKGKHWRDFPVPATKNGFAERIELCLRAQLLDEVIDPLADYVQARTVPSRRLEVESFKRKQHEEALEIYRTT